MSGSSDPAEPFATAEIEARLAELGPGWRVDEQRLVRSFELATFGQAFGLATRIALVAERHDHHPDLEIGWGRLVVTFTSHDVGRLTERDFAMAGRVDRLVERGLGIKEG
jgi:4a-hydroxytetrahydrobiopterin dehydratase